MQQPVQMEVKQTTRTVTVVSGKWIFVEQQTGQAQSNVGQPGLGAKQ